MRRRIVGDLLQRLRGRQDRAADTAGACPGSVAIGRPLREPAGPGGLVQRKVALRIELIEDAGPVGVGVGRVAKTAIDEILIDAVPMTVLLDEFVRVRMPIDRERLVMRAGREQNVLQQQLVERLQLAVVILHEGHGKVAVGQLELIDIGVELEPLDVEEGESVGVAADLAGARIHFGAVRPEVMGRPAAVHLEDDLVVIVEPKIVVGDVGHLHSFSSCAPRARVISSDARARIGSPAQK